MFRTGFDPNELIGIRDILETFAFVDELVDNHFMLYEIKFSSFRKP